ncbi:TPA: DUF2812 domain-containing protein [Clostridium botulinum]|nr:DUF2812 domain-containing protein [Clostridium botulinum]HCL4457154.1 DUF2812 domain-containing protein [Clostridium botulinum]HCL4460840.1 DUF2812 domain-containing protein [Clostridium botulinum]HCL4471897.1 DUF2812 domain-containing protein [Clostridium botulinum]HCL4475491.1 DUF2812 domain-containing protein [Clostridium botulinum]
MEKKKPKNYIYYIYYQQLDNDSDKKEYIQLLKDAGWNFISQYDNMIFLRAEEGTEKIYTDIDTLAIRENK